MRIPTAAVREVAPHFADAAFQHGLQYATESRVHLEKRTWPVVARVQGSVGYVVTVYRDRGTLSGACSCAASVDCKHAAAAALVAVTSDLHRDNGHDLALRQELVGEWLLRLNPQVDQTGPDADEGHAILYVLRTHQGTLGLTVSKSRRLKRGGYNKGAALISVRESQPLPGWVPADDLRRIVLLRTVCSGEHGNVFFDIDALDQDVFRDLAETGRLFWEHAQRPPLAFGPPISRRLEWRPAKKGSDDVRVGVDDKIIVVPGRDLMYVDVDASVMGPLDVGVHSGAAKALLAGPPVPPSMLPTARQSLLPLLTTEDARRSLGPVSGDEVPTLRPHVRLSMIETADHGVSVEAEAHYGEEAFALAEWEEGRRQPRNLVEEKTHLRRLKDLLRNLPRPGLEDGIQTVRLTAMRTLAHRVLPTLQSEGWTIDLPDEFPVPMAEVPDAWTEKLRPAVNYGWFSLELGVRVGEETVSLLPLLLELIKRPGGAADALMRDAERTDAAGLNLTLSDGRLIHVPQERVNRWLRPLFELRLRGLTDKGELCIPSHTAVALDDENVGRFHTDEARGAAREHLRALVDLAPQKEGRGFRGELREYQRRGLAWLRFLHDAGYGGILADDLGLGKTVQLLAFFDGLRTRRSLGKGRPVLVVAPRSVVGQWQSEAQRFTPSLGAAVHLGAERATEPAAFAQASLVITSYQTMLRDVALLQKVPWTSVIFDEAQALKNHATRLRKAAASLSATSKFCVTGTPIENNLTELWSLLDLGMPGLLGRRITFDSVFRKPIETHCAEVPLDFLRKRIRPFVLRRTKGEVARDLPEKTEILERIPLCAEQRDLYESLRLELDEEIRRALGRTEKGSSLVILDALLKLRQCCCDPRLVPLASARKVSSSAKLERLMAMLEDIADSDRAVLVFSQFTSMLSIIEAECKSAGIATLKLTGATRRREQVIAAFQRGAAPVFLISLKAGGSGLNLTRADTVIHYDPWWNPSVEDQATDRAHRIGQTKNVFVYKLIAEGTLEDRLLEMKRDKRARADAVLSGSDASRLAPSDLQALYHELA